MPSNRGKMQLNRHKMQKNEKKCWLYCQKFDKLEEINLCARGVFCVK